MFYVTKIKVSRKEVGLLQYACNARHKRLTWYGSFNFLIHPYMKYSRLRLNCLFTMD